jgi:phospholipid-transporting ATPase
MFDYERPNAYLYKFNGRVTMEDGSKVSIDANNFILRGCSLRNTKWVVGLCAYTGHDTKLMMNSFKARAKRSHLEVAMNNNIVLVFMLMCLISTFGALYYIISSIRYFD